MTTELDLLILKEIITIYEVNHSTQKGLIITKYEQEKKTFFKKKSPHEAFANSKPVQAWKYHDFNLEDVKLDDESIQTQFTGNLYETYVYTTARFIYKEKEKTVYLDTVFGPLFGRGWRFPVVEKDDKLALATPSIIWMS